MNTQPVIVERTYNASAPIVWKAITDKNEMKKWYFELAEFKAEKGFKFQFGGGPSPEKQYHHLWEVTEVIPEKKLTYSWSYEGYPGISYVTFELFPDANKTLLKLSHEGLETFPKENPDLAAGNFAEGWNHIITISLKEFL